MRETVDVTIIGGGPTGLFASFYAGLRGMSVRIIDSLPELGGQLTALYPEKYVYDMPGFPEVLAKDLAHNLIEQGTRFSPEVVLEETASAVRQMDGTWVISGAKGEEYPTRTIIISAGAGAFSPTKMGVPREEELVGRGVSYGVRSLSVFAGRDVVVVGGGDSAFDWALALHPVARRVRILHRRDQFRAHEESVEQARAAGIEFMLWKAVTEILGTDRLAGAVVMDTQTKEESQIECDDLVVNIGFKSSLGPLKEWGLEIEKNQIKVDGLYQTNLPGVFAVGDVCTFDGKIKLIATGVGEAATAVCVAKTQLDPSAKLFPGHSSDMDLKPV
jgi:thioredoxin reductase (NADPH)